MLYEINILELLVLNKLTSTLSKGKPSNKMFEEWLSTAINVRMTFQKKLLDEILSLEKEKQIRHYIKCLNTKLTFIADTLFNTIQAQDENLNYQITNSAKSILEVQKSVYVIIDEIITQVKSDYQKYFDLDENLPEKQCMQVTLKLHQDLMQLKKCLRNTDSKLLEIAFSPFNEVIEEKGQLNYRKASYLTNLMEDLLKSINSDTENKRHVIVSLLIYWNFNSWRFFNYLADKMRKTVEEEKDPPSRLLKYYYYLKEINQTFIAAEAKLNPGKKNLNDLLVNWLLEEITFMERNSEFSYALSASSGNAETLKMLYNLSVPELACFIKIQHDVKLLVNNNITELFKTLSSCVQTKKTKNTSAGDLNKYYYQLEDNALRTIKSFLIQMINEINKRLNMMVILSFVYITIA